MIDLRQAGVDDAAELSRIQVDSWQAYESIFSPAYMAQHNTFERRFLYWMNVLLRGDGRTYLIEDDGQSIGDVTISYPRDEDLPSGTLELTSLYIRTAETGKGYGSYVLRRLFTSVKTAGYDRITLWVLKDNRRAIAFYRHFGFTPDGFEMSLPIQGPILETRMSREL